MRPSVRDRAGILARVAAACLLGLFGAFAYDLVFQIEDLVQKRKRESDQRDIVLYVPDRLLAYDRATGRGTRFTVSLPRTPQKPGAA